LAHLSDAERRLAARSGLHLGEVGEDALGGLGTQVGDGAGVLGRAEVGGQQARELLGLGELALVAAVGAVDVRQAVLRGAALLLLVRLLQVVRAEPLVAGGALGQRVGEGGDVAGGDPHLRGQDHGRGDADHVLARRRHVTPPLTLEVLRELDPEGPVVPGGTLATVGFTGGEYEATALAQADDGVDLVGGHGALFITTTVTHWCGAKRLGVGGGRETWGRSECASNQALRLPAWPAPGPIWPRVHRPHGRC